MAATEPARHSVPLATPHPVKARREQLRDDYAVFHALAIDALDVDPVYPVLKHLTRHWDPEARIRAVFTHVAYYDLGSALKALSGTDGGFVPFGTMPVDLPCATERRAHRTPAKLAAHFRCLDEIAMLHGSLTLWLAGATNPATSMQQAWRNVTYHCLERVTGNGRWASYKTAEMLAKVAGLPLAAPDMGHHNSSGPRQGLEMLYPDAMALTGSQTPIAIAALDQISARHCRWLASIGLPASLEVAETTLCDFHSLAAGRYYVGHDWDVMLAQLSASPSPLAENAMRARQVVAAPRFLGELSGWTGPRKNLKTLYRETGRLEWWA